ncbi:MAG: hypothetical protein ACT4OK_19130 [Gemmobacter sp.]
MTGELFGKGSGMLLGFGALISLLLGFALIGFTVAGDDDDGSDVSL